jgi:hypothetical protein
MRIKQEREMQESSTVLALTMVLLKILILTIIGGLLWLVRIILTEQDQFSNALRGFMPY